jgi:hypothetical protein
VIPATTANGLAVTARSAGMMCSHFRACTTLPWSARIWRHATVRRMKLVKKGAITSTSNRLRHRPALNAIM